MATDSALRVSHPHKTFHAIVWVAQVLLAGMFLMAASAKLTKPASELALMMPYTTDLPLALTRFIGAAELAGALGVVLPALTRIRPWLTPLAASGLVAVMLLAALFHVARGEFFAVPINLTLGALAAFVAGGRVKKVPIASRVS
jgi:hypothetical protein